MNKIISSVGGSNKNLASHKNSSISGGGGQNVLQNNTLNLTTEMESQQNTSNLHSQQFHNPPSIG
jgi:hypothetical protein